MCLQVPGKVIEKNGKDIKVDYDIETRDAIIYDVDCNVGDWVLVVGKFVIEIVPEKIGRKSFSTKKRNFPYSYYAIGYYQ